MIGAVLASGIGFLAVAGSLLIRDQRALLLFIGLSAIAAFLSALSFQAPEAVLGLTGLAAGTVSIKRRMRPQRRLRLYRSKKRLEKLEEGARELPKNIVDIVPAGSKRGIHPELMRLILLTNDAALKGYAVKEPEWLATLRQYYTLLGSAASPSKTLVVSEHEVVEL
mgnify:CR=1 FL=1